VYQIVPLNSSPNQNFLANLTVNGAALKLNLSIRFNEIAQYWTMGVADANNTVILASVPLLTGSWPAANILGQYQYKQIGSCYLLNVSNGGNNLDYPNGQNLGTDFILLWGDNV
jgi:hypothetical protein